MSIKAPFSGRITQRFVDKGALVQSGLVNDDAMAIVEIQELNPIRLTVPIPESDISSIVKGMAVKITFPELPGEDFEATVSRISGALDPSSKTMRIEIDLQNPKEIFKPGMYAKVSFQTSSSSEVVSLPITAQVILQDRPFILAVEGNVVKKIPLRKGMSSKDYFEVLNSEITEKTLIIVQGKGLVKDGQMVKPILKEE